ncbi:hypothetical protein FV139_08480 [Parahaliea maris]|uniref:Lipoprotein n=1 Tax=Parahaliea maris TaxID=2716870 RepID=A0A5C8ZYX0_9GAMM|nr:DUF6279 family lipoprotein [Parahaliea maris]TXS93668.1 hypothetical protein FV139_08480 [Parahaliea maris]
MRWRVRWWSCWRRRLPALFIALLVTGCSSTTFLYNRLDFLVPWYVDDYVELDRGQEQVLDELLEPFLEWHREEELPRYVTLLHDAEAMLDSDGLTLGEIRELTRGMELAGDRVQTRSLDWLLAMGEQLSDEQVAEFITNLEEKQAELEEKYLERDQEEYREDAYDRLLDNLDDYLGRLDRKQKETLRTAVAGLDRSDELWLAERQAWTDRLKALLQREPGWQDAVRVAVASRWDSASPEYRVMYEQNVSVIQGAVMEVVNTRSKQQDRHLRRKVHNLREDFLALSREGRSTEQGAPAVTGAP